MRVERRHEAPLGRRRDLALRECSGIASRRGMRSRRVGSWRSGRALPWVLSDDGLVALFTHPGDAKWTEVVPVAT